MGELGKPQWQRELENFIGVKSLFVLEGNVHDLYPTWGDGAGEEIDFLPMQDLLATAFGPSGGRMGYRMVFYDVVSHFTNPHGNPRMAEVIRVASEAAEAQARRESELNAYASDSDATATPPRLVTDARIIRAMLTGDMDVPGDDAVPTCVVVSMASRLLPSSDSLMPEDVSLFSQLLCGAEESRSPDGANRNALVLLVDALGDLPAWFTVGNPNLRSVMVPRPDRRTRQAYIDLFYGLGDTGDPELSEARESFIDRTDGMTLRELDELRRMHVRQGGDATRLPSLVDVYKYGMRESRWAEVSEKLRNDPRSALMRRVKGQDHAIDAVLSVLKRSAMGLSGSTHSGGGKPKGVLFLAGPTGTGKTELVKAVTEFLFGDERSMIRFDMSEYRGDNSDQRLFGAPPGYVGYANGGQLTNAVKANPFSVLLFDEIEKANPSVMDKFLQILEDGRMTDGQGKTVYFSETIIFFTSNVGFSQEVYDPTGHSIVERLTLIHPDEGYDAICAKVNDAMRASFKPEFMGRIGNNVIVFNFIDDRSAYAILRHKLSQINAQITKSHGVGIVVDKACMEWLLSQTLDNDVKEKGGRGIGNLIESRYLNPLSDYLFDATLPKGTKVVVSAGDGRLLFKGVRG